MEGNSWVDSIFVGKNKVFFSRTWFDAKDSGIEILIKKVDGAIVLFKFSKFFAKKVLFRVISELLGHEGMECFDSGDGMGEDVGLVDSAIPVKSGAGEVLSNKSEIVLRLELVDELSLLKLEKKCCKMGRGAVKRVYMRFGGLDLVGGLKGFGEGCGNCLGNGFCKDIR